MHKMSDPWRKRKEYLGRYGWSSVYDAGQHKYWWIDPKTDKYYNLRDGVCIQRDRTDDFGDSVMPPAIDRQTGAKKKKRRCTKERPWSKEAKLYAEYVEEHGVPPLVEDLWIGDHYEDLRDMEALTYWEKCPPCKKCHGTGYIFKSKFRHLNTLKMWRKKDGCYIPAESGRHSADWKA
jgi:hypothetical protein